MQQTYTYRNGEKITLEKKPDQFVVRALPDQLQHLGFQQLQQVSSASTRVTTTNDQLEALMALSRFMAPAHHAYRMASNGQEFLITDRVLIVFKESLTSHQIDLFSGELGLVLLTRYDERSFLFQLTSHTGMNPCKLVVKLMEEDDRVAIAEHDLNYRIEKYDLPLPSDPEYVQQWHLHERFNHPWFDARSTSHCEAAWDLLKHFGSPEIVIGVADDGCKLDHPDFDGPEKFAGWGYFQGTRLVAHTDIDADPAQMYKYGSDHGTSSAAVAAGNANATHTVGAAPGCKLLPVKWQSNGPFLAISDSKLLTAINYMADKVDIMSNSWGITPTSIWWPQVVNRIKELAQTGGPRKKGILFLWAAGNNNAPINYIANQDIPYTSGWEFNVDGSRTWEGVRTTYEFRNNLVGIPGVIHIAALASTAKRSHYSNFGPGISLCGPSSNGHAYFRMSVPGLGVTTATGIGQGVTRRFGGTSSATPLVAGIAALILSANPSLTALNVVSILQRTASKDLNFDGYDRTPPANFNPDTSWDVSTIEVFPDGSFKDAGSPDGSWSPWFGHGKVDALKAVQEALKYQRATTGELISKESKPAATIPDNDPQGAVDTIVFEESGRVDKLSVQVSIDHSYIGDLIIKLISPDEDEIILHNRKGGSRDNLKKFYAPDEVPDLNQMVGKSIKGVWKMKVIDNASMDTGTWNSWSIQIQVDDAQEIVIEQEPKLKIPDNVKEGIDIVEQVEEEGVLRNIDLKVDITHSYIGDLSLSLICPSGKEVVLHNRQGGRTENIIKEFTLINTPLLRALIGEPIKGDWRLRVADQARVDTGKLNYWRLRLWS